MSHILTLSDRTVIQTLLKVGYSQKQIAKEVGVAPSTINKSRQPCPEYTNCTKSSNKRPVPNILPDSPSFEIMEASSTINNVLVAKLSLIEKLLSSLEKDCCLYIFL